MKWYLCCYAIKYDVNIAIFALLQRVKRLKWYDKILNMVHSTHDLMIDKKTFSKQNE